MLSVKFSSIFRYKILPSYSFISAISSFSSQNLFCKTSNPHNNPIMSTELKEVNQQWNNIVKSERDTRQYRALELKNRLTVMLISDPTTDKSAACMDVHIGSMMQPKDLPGLPHFCEHMLFLGTKKYPTENAYKVFVSDHAGSTNAYTSDEHTNYFFDVSPSHLSEALDLFAQFFLAPLFTESAVDREVNAVNSENDKNLFNDSWRVRQLTRNLSDPNHDYNHFSTGTRASLYDDPLARGINIRDELLKFHAKYYSANIMSLTVLGTESLDELTKLVLNLFSGVANMDVEIPSWSTTPLTKEFKMHKIYMTPIKHARDMTVTWPMPDYRKDYKSDPVGYLSHLIGHEGKGSLLSELKAQGWVNDLGAGGGGGARGFSSFSVSITLTEQGIDHVDDIVLMIYQYIEMLRKEGPKEWIFEEEMNFRKRKFDFKEKENPINYVSAVSGILKDYPIEDVLSSRLTNQFRPDLITELLNMLTPDNSRLILIAQEYADICTETEKWYSTKYANVSIPEDLLKKWRNCGSNPKFFLPSKNEYIPTDFTLLTTTDKQTSKVPELLMNSSQSRLWYKQDQEFNIPKSYFTCSIISPMSFMDPLSHVLTSLFVEVFNDAINEDTYNATIAGLSFSVARSNQGLVLYIYGYNHKLDVLLSEILNRIIHFSVNKSRFESLHEATVRQLKNFSMGQPYQQGAYYLSFLLTESTWLNQELLAAMPDATIEALEKFIPQLFSRVFVESFLYGNVTADIAKTYHNKVVTTLTENLGSRPAARSQIALQREVILPPGSHHTFQRLNLHQPTSSLDYYLQFPEQSTHNNMLAELFCKILEEPCFSILRTEEQLGYIVGSAHRTSNFMQGMRIVIQSDRRPDFLEQRVKAFLEKLTKTLNEMDDAEFGRNVQALYDSITEKPKNMKKQNAIYLSEIASRHYHFERSEIEATHLKTITKEDILDFFNTYVSSESTKRKLLAVHILSSSSHGDTLPIVEDNYQGNVIEDPLDFKQALPLSPLAQPMVVIDEKNSAKL